MADYVPPQQRQQFFQGWKPDTGYTIGPGGLFNNRGTTEQQQLDLQGRQLDQQDTFNQRQLANEGANRQFQGDQAQAERTTGNQRLERQLFEQGQQRQFEGGQADLNRQQQERLQGNQFTFQGGQNQADRDLQWRTGEATRTFQGGQNDLDRRQQLTLQGNQLDFQGRDNAAQRANSLQIADLPWQFKTARWNELRPSITAALSGLTGGAAGGQNDALPNITVGPVWDPGQVQQQVNASNAHIAGGSASQQRQLAQQNAGRGFGGNSGLLAALQAGVGSQALASQADAARGIRWDAAQGNAQQQLASEVARQGQWNDAQNADIRRRQLAVQNPATILGALTGLLG